MSVAREEFLNNLLGIEEAIKLEYIAQGATGARIPPGIFVLRRGILIAGLIALETFVRDRTNEILCSLERWPRSYNDLPEKLRLASRLNSLSYLQSYARMLKRQGDDYEGELQIEIAKMASGQGTVQRFTKYVAGDYTGNISDTSLKELLSSLQVNDCWAEFRIFAGDTGIGVPSVQEIVKEIVRKRHRSAHSAGYVPNAGDIAGLGSDLLCVAMCFDVAVSCSMEQALASPTKWASGKTNWREGVNLYIASPHPSGWRLAKSGSRRALRIVREVVDVRTHVPRASPGTIAVLVNQNASGRPTSWGIL